MTCQSKAINGADFAGGLSVNSDCEPSPRAGVPPTVSVRSMIWSNMTWSPELRSTVVSSLDVTAFTPLQQQ